MFPAPYADPEEGRQERRLRVCVKLPLVRQQLQLGRRRAGTAAVGVELVLVSAAAAREEVRGGEGGDGGCHWLVLLRQRARTAAMHATIVEDRRNYHLV